MISLQFYMLMCSGVRQRKQDSLQINWLPKQRKLQLNFKYTLTKWKLASGSANLIAKKIFHYDKFADN